MSHLLKLRKFRTYYYRNKEKRKKKHQINEKTEKVKNYRKQQRIDYKKKVFEFYSNGNPKCGCCGETIIVFLTIDHINGRNGSEESKLRGGKLYRWLVWNEFPPGYQVLCWNCNYAKYHNGECPHRYLKIRMVN